MTSMSHQSDRASASTIDPNTIDNQDNSPLLRDLPSEIRISIFSLVLTAYYDKTKPYDKRGRFYRPGYEFRTKVDCRLLFTCKRIWLEARLLLLSVNEFQLWKEGLQFSRFSARIGPLVALWNNWYRRLTVDQKDSIGHVHIFANQIYWFAEQLGIEAFCPSCPQEEPLLPDTSFSALEISAENLHLTFRHYDWYRHSSGVAGLHHPTDAAVRYHLALCPYHKEKTSYDQMFTEPRRPGAAYVKENMTASWAQVVGIVTGLKVLSIEFETYFLEKAHLEVLVKEAEQWKFLLKDSSVLEWTGRKTEYTWEGVRDLRQDWKECWHHDQDIEGVPMCTYYCVVMKWEVCSSSHSSEEEEAAP